MKRKKFGLSAAAAKPAPVPHPSSGPCSADALQQQLQGLQRKMQIRHEELAYAQTELEQSRDRYFELYEYAPVAYLTLSLESVITKINLTGAQLLGEERRTLLHRRFDCLIIADDQVRYRQMLAHIAGQKERQTCALTLRRSDGSLLYVQLDCTPVTDGHNSPMRLTLTDLTERKRAEAEIANLAFYDPLTHLPNRRLLLDRIMHASHACYRNSKHGALLLLDLDHFKILNDTQGHEAGDRLLRQAAQRLTACVREMDTVARLGGDEFVVLLEDLSSDPILAAEQAKHVGDKILGALRTPYVLATQEYRSTCSLGITLFCSDREPVEDILKRADLALYRSKGMGRGLLQFFDPDLEAEVKARVTLEAEIRQGLQEEQFVLHYQPQVDSAGAMTGVEALVRWQHPTRGLLGPAEFIPLAEEKGLILSIGNFVLSSVCARLAEWAAFPETAQLTISINLSACEFSHPNLVGRTLDMIYAAGANPERLIIEVTESFMLGNLAETNAKMRTLKAHGIRFSLDDFGMGFSSLAYLKSLPLDQLKIDGAFVRDMLTESSDAAIVSTIMTLGRSLGLSVIAEGVETEEQRVFLALHGCRAYQGNLFGKPRLSDDVDSVKSSELRYQEAEAD